MKATLLVPLAALALSACVSTSSPPTAWGKEGVSMLDYRTDAGQCAVMAATYNPNENGANTAGGVNGSNTSRPVMADQSQRSSQVSAPGSGSTPDANAGSTPTIGVGSYRDADNADFVQRAITQQRAQEMAAQRARSGALKSCLVERGYQEFALTPEQQKALSKLPQGSDERRDYLYKLGTDPQVLRTQAAPKPAK